MATPFPGTLGGRPFGSFALHWSLPQERRSEIAWIELGPGRSLRARGRQWCTGEEPYLLAYDLETGRDYVTERLEVRVAGGPELTLVRGASGELDDVLDCDLGFSPLTNAHEGGEAREIDVAWVSVPDLAVHRDHQIYDPLGDRRVRFESPGFAFERVIELTRDGFVRNYPDIARLTTRFTRSQVR
jgi:hypothetical protein